MNNQDIRDAAAIKAADVALTSAINTIPGGGGAITGSITTAADALGTFDDKIEQLLFKGKQNENLDKARQIVGGLPGGIFLIVFLIIGLVIMLALTYTGVGLGYTGDSQLKKNGGYKDTTPSSDKGDGFLIAASWLSFSVGIVGLLITLTTSIVMVIRFILKPRVQSYSKGTISDLDKIFGSRVLEIVSIVLNAPIAIFFIVWIVINGLNAGNNGRIIKEIKDKENPSDNDKKKIETSRGGMFTLTSIITPVVFIVVVIIIGTIIARVVISSLNIQNTILKTKNLALGNLSKGLAAGITKK